LEEASITELCRGIIEKTGCRLFPAAFKVLEEFGGLTIARNHPRNERGDPADPAIIHIDPAYIDYLWGPPKEWFGWEWCIGEVLFPIGDVGGELEIVIASSGKVYALGTGDFFCGHSWDEALENLKGNGTIVSIPLTDAEANYKLGERVCENLMAE
jgi:hypothetical protein